jgi:hypothetical protein
MAKPEPLGRALARGVCLGWWTLEQLDAPSPEHQALERDRLASQNPCDVRNPHERVPVYPSGNGSDAYMTFPRPVMPYPMEVPKYRNLAREWIRENNKEWQEMKLEYNVPADPEVQISSPRDFIPAAGPTPAEEPDLPLTLEQPLTEAPW